MRLEGAIFDVDGVLVDSPHERAWREALEQLMASDWRGLGAETGYRPGSFTTAVYQEFVAGKPRLSGAQAVLEYFRIPDAERRALEYADRKQWHVVQLIVAGKFVAFPDALRLALALKARGLRLGVASSSENANRFLQLIRLDQFVQREGLREPPIPPGQTLLELFEANVCGRDLPQGKPHPAIFQLAARELGLKPAACLVVEDAPAGIQAARAGGMLALGIARVGDEALLWAAGADVVVTSLDEVEPDALIGGHLPASRPSVRGRLRASAGGRRP